MATIDISRTHSLGPDAVRERAEELARDMQTKLGIEWQWQGQEITFKAASGVAKGTKGKVSVGADKVRVEIDLPLLLRAMKGAVTERVERKLDKLVGAG